MRTPSFPSPAVLVGALLLVLAVGACGQKGPLYLPDEPAKQGQRDEDAEKKKDDGATR